MKSMRYFFAFIVLLVTSIKSGIAQINRYGSSVEKSIIESQIICQSPNVAEMSRCVDRPVTYFNGSVGVTIPLCDVIAGDITLPISLSYNSTGFKPSQEATWVGFGWSFSLNSCISRYIKCADDFLEYDLRRKRYASMHSGYYGSASYSTNALTEQATAFSCPMHSLCTDNVYVDELVVDVEPDIFSYSLWNGGDKFVITNDTSSSEKATFTDRSAGYKLRIYSYRDSLEGTGRLFHYFELISRDGTIYEFKKRELTYTYSYGNEASANCNVIISGYEGASHDIHASSWFLTKVTTPKKYIIEFEYEDEDFDAISQETCLRYTQISSNLTSSNTEYMSGFADENGIKVTQKPAVYSWSKSKIKTARLKEIRWKNGRIVFKSSSRDDMYNSNVNEHTPQKLDEINVYNSTDSIVHSYKFGYEYFGKNNTNNSWDDCLYKRLKLKSIKDSLTANFQYTFEYQDEDGNYPSKQTKSLDYWGYYNGKDYGRLYYCQAFDGNRVYDGAIKNSNESTTKLGMLTAIVHPTGSRETFSYEPNHFLWTSIKQTGGQKLGYAATINFNNEYHGVKTCTLNTNEKVCLKIKGMYYTSSPTGNPSYVTSNPLLFITDTETNTLQEKIYASNANWQVIEPDSIVFNISLEAGSYTITAYPPNVGWNVTWNFDKYDPNPVTFETVSSETTGAGLRIKQIVGNGKIRNFSYPDVGKLLIDPVFYETKRFLWLKSQIDSFEKVIDNCLIQFSESSVPLSTFAKGYDLGYESVVEEVPGVNHSIITKYQYEQIHKEFRRSPNPYQSTFPEFSNGLLKEKTICDRNMINNDTTTVYHEYIYNQSSQSQNIPAHDFTYTYGLNELYPNRFKWNSIGSKIITADGFTSNINYTYNDDLMLKSVTTSCDGMPNVKESVVYSSEVQNDYVCEKMRERNIIVPVETTKTAGNNLASKTKMDYSEETSGLILPNSISSYNLETGTFCEDVRYDIYDDYGNVIQETRKGTPIVYIYGYNNTYPIAKIVGADYNQVREILGVANIQNNADEIIQDVGWQLGMREQLKNNLPDALVNTYTYKPLVGITSETLPNGNVIYYEYDASGRLACKKDRNGKVIQQYGYNYKNR